MENKTLFFGNMIFLILFILLLSIGIINKYHIIDLNSQIDNLQQHKTECLNKLTQRSKEIYNCEETKTLWIDLENQCEIANKQLKQRLSK